MNDPIAKPRHWGRIILLALLGFFLSLVVAFVLLVINTPPIEPAAPAVRTPVVRVSPVGTSTSFSFGTSSPLITIVEFGDFSCPHCRNTYSTIREISLRYQDRVKFVFRDFPAVSEHSYLLSLAAHCAGEQEKFWPMHDQLFQNQGVTTLAEVAALGDRVGLDRRWFLACMQEERPGEAILVNYDEGKALGVTGTPTWFINGEKIEGEIPAETFRKAIADLLNR